MKVHDQHSPRPAREATLELFSRRRRLEKPSVLLPPCAPFAAGAWADIGCGDGIFSQGLLEASGAASLVTGVDIERSELSGLLAWAGAHGVSNRIRAVQADFLEPLPFRDLVGIVAANALHFIPDTHKGAVLGQFLRALAPGGQLILVEYSADRGNPAVPYPKRATAWLRLMEEAGFRAGRLAAQTPSSFLGEMVALTAARPARS